MRTSRLGTKKRNGYRSLGAVLVMLLAVAASRGIAAAEIDFNRQIRPILAEHCFACHGPDEEQRQAELRLDVRESAVAGAIVPGDADDSELLHRVLATDPDVRMPPPDSQQKPLDDQQIQLLRQWIDGGARYAEHWSFLPPRKVTPPATARDGWNENPIDQFVAASLAAEGLEPQPEADRRSLIRRVSLDLTGLPPTADEVAAFVDDRSDDAYEKVVDRLLKSPHYGEHRARFWLDAARYADTNGYQYDLERNQWVWRDWVIHAFNSNLPFDEFTVQQIAGDLLPDATPFERLATGFHRNHPITIEGGVIDEEYRTEYVVDRVVTTGTVWLGLTMRCARCHDHKYDPISQRDFYEFFAYFNQVPERGLRGFDPAEKIASPLQDQQRKRAAAAATAAREQLQRLLDAAPEQLSRWERQASELAQQRWLTPDPIEVKSEGGATLTRQADGSYLASGKNPATEVYQFDFSPTETVHAIRIEALTDPSFVEGSTGRASNGNFVLTELEVLRFDSDVEKASQLPLSDAVADYSQPNYAVTLAIDGKYDQRGWAVDGNTKRENRWMYAVLKTPHSADAGKLRVRIVHRWGQSHQIGRFRVSYSDRPVSALPADLAALLNVAPQQRTAAQASALKIALARRYGSADMQRAIAALDAAEAHQQQLNDFPTTMVMKRLPQPRKTHILYRGQYNEKREEVSADIPDALPQPSPVAEQAQRTRLDLARWIVSRDNPLTARVTVNRFWHQLFGVGMVETVEDFGTQGAYPTHPELLDYLAVEFMESGWDTKALLKQIVMSQTYRQSSRAPAALLASDPRNRKLARGPRLRMDAETIRDSALAVSGLLVRQVGGPSVFPYHPPGLWQEINNRPGYSRVYQQDAGNNLYRRSLYTFWKRTVPPPSMSAFDAPGREYCVVRRSRTNTPLQAFVLLNDPQFVEAARHLGQKMMEHPGDDAERIEYGFQLAFARLPTAAEQDVLLETLQARRRQYRQHPSQAVAVLQIGESPDTSADKAEAAAWATAGRILLNLSEFITKE